jgi:hypothetical protein
MTGLPGSNGTPLAAVSSRKERVGGAGLFAAPVAPPFLAGEGVSYRNFQASLVVFSLL